MWTWYIKYRGFLFLILVVSSVAIIYGYREYVRGFPDTHDLKADYILEASDLSRQFEINEIEADEAYAGKVISVQGFIKSLQYTDSSATVLLNDGNSVPSVVCQMAGENLPEARGLKLGSRVNIKGVCTGYLMDIIMVRCVVAH